MINKKYKIIAQKIVGKNNSVVNTNNFILENLKSLPDGAKILDAGAGRLKWKKACSHLEYVSQDFCQYDGKGDGHGLHTGSWNNNNEYQIDIVSDIIDIPVDDGVFDAILCSEVLEHLEKPELAIKEFSRILKPGGKLILTAPFCSLTHFAPYHFCTGFNIYWYEKILNEYGFKIEIIKRNGNYFSYMWQETLRIPFICGQYARKRDFITTFFAIMLAMRLKRYKDNQLGGGEELLCLGYHVKAEKIK